MVKMELPSSKSQASSVKSIGSDLKSKIAAFQSALSSVSGIASFKGVAASKAKEYAESNMRMIAESANDLVDGVVKSVSQLPSEYTGQVDSKSHDSEKLQQSINQLQQQQSTLNSALDAVNKLSDSNSSKGSMIGNIKGLQSANSAKLKKQQELLQKLLQFDSNSPRYFDDIDSLFSAFEQAADNVKLDYNASSGSYGSFAVPPTVNELLKKANSGTKRWDKKHKPDFDWQTDANNAIDMAVAGDKDYFHGIGKNTVADAGKCVGIADRFGNAMDIGFGALGVYTDMQEGKNLGQAIVHTGAGVVIGAGVGLAVAGAPAIVGAALVGIAVIGYDYIYDNVKPVHNFIDDIGNNLNRNINSAGNAIKHGDLKKFIFE